MSEENGWSLSSNGLEFLKKNMGTIYAMLGIDAIIAGIKIKFANRNWILVDHKGKVEVWSILDNEGITTLDDDLVLHAHKFDGGLLEPNDAILEFVALRFVAARDVENSKLTHVGVNLRKWLKTLPIDKNIIDGSCVDKFLDENGEEQAKI